jgi:hypothetical protein
MTTSVIYEDPIRKKEDEPVLLAEDEPTVARPTGPPPSPSRQVLPPPHEQKTTSPYTTNDYYKRRGVEYQKNIELVRGGNNFSIFRNQPNPGLVPQQRPVSADMARK